MSARRTAWIAWSMCGLTFFLAACALALAILNGAAAGAVSLSLGVTASAIVGGLVASRRPENPVGWFFLASAACFALVGVASEYPTYALLTAPGNVPGVRAMTWLTSWLWVPGVMLLLCFIPLYFPDGRLVSRRWRWVVRLALFFSFSVTVYSALRPGEIQNEGGVVNPLGIEALRPIVGILDTLTFTPYFFLLFASAASLIVRFRRSGSVERQQIKWLAFAAVAIPVWFLTNAPVKAISSNLFLVMDALVVFALIPVAAGISILRYRLYDIDVVINRTLVYGSLTAMLAAVYFGGVATTQVLFRTLTGQEEPPQLAIVVSTLVIAALFNPLRRRIQSFIDRRFYRRKYDARKTLDTFSSKLRDETDLDRLGEHLTGVVAEAMQPTHVSLWLRPGTASKGKQAEQ